MCVCLPVQVFVHACAAVQVCVYLCRCVCLPVQVCVCVTLSRAWTRVCVRRDLRRT